MAPRRSSSTPAILAVALAGLVALAAAAAGAGAAAESPREGAAAARAAASTPRCFGAAARDPEHPCDNPALRRTATPSPDDAPLEASSPCDPLEGVVPSACSFGSSSGTPASSVALIGDSHAAALRPAVDDVARAKRWRGVSITRDACPFTNARTPGAKGVRCKGWTGSVVRWLKAHREVRQVIVTANSGTGVVRAQGRTLAATKIAGYIAAWKSLPRSVRRIYVIRDVPHGSRTTNDCVRKVLARHRNPASRCARKRERALRPDLAAVAAQQTDSERVAPIDLTPFMCDATYCFPVVGGALVIKDIGHLTRAFASTLGPYLGRAIARVQVPGP